MPNPSHDSEASQRARNREAAETRDRFRYWLTIPSRWQDGDPYGHVNNVVYYSWFDTVVTRMLYELQILRGPHWNAIGLCIESKCVFHKAVSFPESVDAGLRIGRIGNTSVRYELGLFLSGDDRPCASGHFIHVFVDRDSRRPQALPEAVRQVLASLALQ